MPPRKTQELGKSFETFTYEVKDFFNSRSATCVVWCSYILSITATLIIIIVSATPSWGVTQEVIGQGGSNNLEGEVYGYYGVWYICWDSVMGYGRTCLKWSDADFTPVWWPAFQSMMTLGFISGFASFMLMSFYMFARTLNRNMRLLGIVIFADCMTVVFCVTGFVVFCVLFLHDSYWCCHPDINREFIHYNLWWGFIMACVATGLYMISVIFAIFECMDILKERRIELEFEEWRQRESRMEFSHHTYDPSFQNAAMMGYGNMWR